MAFTKKQLEYIRNSHRRWNIASGATQSGKSYLSYAYLLPARIRERADKDGLIFILGVSQSTIERNILAPAREIWGEKLVGTIKKGSNTARLFGRDVYCIGAEKINQVSKLRGASVSYALCDELAEYSQEVFIMLQSRLSKPWSLVDAALNPKDPNHWVKKFIDSDADIYLQEYTLFDNEFLPQTYIDSLCNEYKGTVYYNRYVLGEWKRAEGAIYRIFADSPSSFLCKIVDKIDPNCKTKQILKSNIGEITIGLDFGGNKSSHALCCTAKTIGYRELIALESERHFDKDGTIDSNKLDQIVLAFVQKIIDLYGYVDNLYFDNAEVVLGKSIKNAIESKYPDIIVRGAKKIRIKDRIDATVRLMGSKRLWITESILNDNSENGGLRNALCDAVYDDKKEDERLDSPNVSDIDSLDAFEYSFERDIKKYLN